MMAATLVEKDLWDVVDGSLTHPVGSPNHKAMKTLVKKQQLAHAKIILIIEASQLLHTCHDDPRVIWDSLQKVHQAHGFTTCLSLHCCFLYMHKWDEQPVISWVSDIKKATFQLQAPGVFTINKNIILALTEGLPESFSTFIVTLDSLPTSAGMNASMDPMMALKIEPDVALLAMVKGKCQVSEITCYQCSGKGHYQSSCPSPEVHTAAVVDDKVEGRVW